MHLLNCIKMILEVGRITGNHNWGSMKYVGYHRLKIKGKNGSQFESEP